MTEAFLQNDRNYIQNPLDYHQNYQQGDSRWSTEEEEEC